MAPSHPPTAAAPNAPATLVDLFGSAPTPAPAKPSAPAPAPVSAPLVDLFGAAPVPPTAPMGANPLAALGLSPLSHPMPPTAPAPTLAGLGGMSFSPAPALPNSPPPALPGMQAVATPGGAVSVVAHDKPGALRVTMDATKAPTDGSVTVIRCRFFNSGAVPLTNLVFQAAVPKYLRVELMPASGTTVAPLNSAYVEQELRVTNSQQGAKGIALKLKLVYDQGGVHVDEIAQVSSFPPNF